jgi:hypothetical protein
MKTNDQQLLEEAYNAVVTEGVLPSKAFRSKPLHQKKVLYRLFAKPDKKMGGKYFWGEKLSWAGEFESVEEALVYLKNLYVYSEDMEYVIKEVIIEYSEKTVEQSGLRQMRDDLPELKGIF